MIAECEANLECRVVDRFTTGDHSIFVGEVVAAWAQDQPGPLLCVVDESAGFETVLATERFRFGVVRGLGGPSATVRRPATTRRCGTAAFHACRRDRCARTVRHAWAQVPKAPMGTTATPSGRSYA